MVWLQSGPSLKSQTLPLGLLKWEEMLNFLSIQKAFITKGLFSIISIENLINITEHVQFGSQYFKCAWISGDDVRRVS